MKKYLILDTETANGLDDPLVYDLGFSVIDENARKYESKSLTIADIFLEKDFMQSAYYKEKVPKYWDEIKTKKRILCKYETARKIVAELMRKYNIDTVVAHNVRFDYRSTNTTQRYLTKSRQRYFFPYGTQFVCTLKMAREVFGKDENYIHFCEENGYLCKNGKPRFTAEIVFRFLINDTNFVEAHTGFEDTEIEKEIFAECLRRCPEIDGTVYGKKKADGK